MAALRKSMRNISWQPDFIAENAVEPGKIHRNFADRRSDPVYYLAEFYGTIAVDNVGMGLAVPAVLNLAVVVPALRAGTKSKLS